MKRRTRTKRNLPFAAPLAIPIWQWVVGGGLVALFGLGVAKNMSDSSKESHVLEERKRVADAARQEAEWAAKYGHQQTGRLPDAIEKQKQEKMMQYGIIVGIVLLIVWMMKK